jgi:hypothetical protein
MSEWDVFSKFIQWTRGLEQTDQLAFFGGGLTAFAPLLYLLWNRGHHSGVKDGKRLVLDGRVREHRIRESETNCHTAKPANRAADH